jgi:hypothetical protein
MPDYPTFQSATDEFFPALTLPTNLLNIHILRSHCNDHDMTTDEAFDAAYHGDDLPLCIEQHLITLLGTDHPTDSTFQDLLDDICAFDLHLTALTN